MTFANEKKKEQLGMPHGTAQNRLRKSILWSYVVKCGDNTCYQCGQEITDPDTLSIEHKEPWLDSEDPIETFFNLENIAYSHHSCNIRAARKTYAPCGTFTKYKRGCKCELCTKANRDHARLVRANCKARIGRTRPKI